MLFVDVVNDDVVFVDVVNDDVDMKIYVYINNNNVNFVSKYNVNYLCKNMR